MEKLIFEKSQSGRSGVLPPKLDIDPKELSSIVPDKFLREDFFLPELSQLDVVRHYTNLAKLNFSVDANFYPLGSCTMKYNPKINESLSRKEGFSRIHPYQPLEHLQGALEIIYEFEQFLCEITGMSAFSFQPAAGAHGELLGMFLVRAYHRNKKNNKNKVIIPDSAHGTNPASSAIAGYDIVEIESKQGLIDIDKLAANLDDQTAAIMLTNPNTLGLFEKDILKIADMAHKKDALLYYDGANFNALLGVAKPSLLGFDVMHINLHKTFATPHGGGGPGSGPVGVTKNLIKFLPLPVVKKTDRKYFFDYDLPDSVGKIRSFYGNFLVVIKAYLYLLSLGKENLKDVARFSVLNANYLLSKLKNIYDLAFEKSCMHEVVFSLKNQKEKGVSALDLAKRLIDFGIHPPTIYFPLIVKEALMIEPTETESKQTLDYFIEVMEIMSKEIDSDPQIFKDSPKLAPVSRLDEVKAVKDLDIRWKP